MRLGLRLGLGLGVLAVITSTVVAQNCGAGANGAQCLGSECCSEYGWCGTTDDHCSSTCMSTYNGPTGECADGPGPSPVRCGPEHDDAVCAAGSCCSEFGWCGETVEHCTGCDPMFGSGCMPPSPSPSPLPPRCGNGKCENTWMRSGETCGNCPTDCGPCQRSSILTKCRNRNHYALTFDDGPSAVATSQLLTILRKENVPAAFFVVGEMVNFNPATLIRTHREGYYVASHTMAHPHLNSLSLEEVSDELNDAQAAISSKVCVRPRFYRQPFGELNTQRRFLLRNMGLRSVLWTLDTLDYLHFGTPGKIEEIVENALQSLGRTGPIHLQHDLQPESVATVPALIKLINAAGKKIVPLRECVDGRFFAFSSSYRWEQARCNGDFVPSPPIARRRLQDAGVDTVTPNDLVDDTDSALTEIELQEEKQIMFGFETGCPTTLWSDWSGCDSTCGDGMRTRTRYTMPESLQYTNSSCADVELLQMRSCEEFEPFKPLPKCTGSYSEWSEWSPCSRECGGGTQMSYRVVHAEDPHGYEAPLVRTQLCNMESCMDAAGRRRLGRTPYHTETGVVTP